MTLRPCSWSPWSRSVLPILGAALSLAPLSSVEAQSSRRFEVRALQTGLQESVVELADVTGEGEIDLLSSGASGPMLWKGDGGGNFCPPAPLPGGGFVEDLLCADVDVDGDLDVLAAAYGVTVRKNNGNAVFTTGITYGSEGRRVAVGDLNNDGWPDAATSDHGGGSGARTLLNLGSGSFGTQLLGPWQLGTTSDIGITDVNGDGDLDLLVIDVWNGLRLLTGDGSGDYSSTTPQGPTFPGVNNWWALDVADTDNDGDPDVVIGGGPDNVVMLVPTVGGALDTPVTLSTLGNQQGIRLADMDGDGDLEVVSGAVAYGHLSIWENLGGSFGPAVLTPSMVGALGLDVADLDGDGAQDVVSTGFYTGGFAVHMGDGTGGVQGPAGVAGLTQLESVATGDLDGDGWTDLVSGAQWPLGIRVNLGSPTGFGPITAPFGSIGGNAVSIRVFDLDSDGDRDVVWASGSGVERVLGNGLGAFGPGTLTVVGPGLMSVREADLDNDGDRDLVTSHDASGLIGAGVIQNLGGGVLGAWASAATGSDAMAVALGDLDGDGLTDAVLADTAPTTGLRSLRNLGAAVLAPWTFKPTASPRDVTLGDFNLDGQLDVAEVQYAPAEARVHPGLGNGSFGAPIVRPVPIQPTAVTTADIDNDTLIDVVMVGNGHSVQVLLNDGLGSLSYPEVYVSGGYGNSLAVDDVNLDGRPDVVVGGIFFLGASVLYGLADFSGQVQGLGNGLAGQSGIPLLQFFSPMLPGGFYQLQLTGGLGSAPAWILMSPSFANLPFLGGVLVPDPTTLIILPTATDFLGMLQPSGSWPYGIPSGANLYLQVWIADGAGPQGYSASNGLQLTTP